MATKRQSSGGSSNVTTYVANATDPSDDPPPDIAPSGKAIQYAQPYGRPGSSQYRRKADGSLETDPLGNPIPWAATRLDPSVARIGGETAGRLQPVAVAPRYYEGDAEEILTNMPPELLAQLQQEMIDARIFGKNPNIVYKVPDAETVNAFKMVLAAANNTGLDYETVIQNWTKIAKNAPPPPPTPHVNTVTNTTDLVATFKTASRSALGREISDAEARRYAAVFQGQETSAQNAANAAQDAGLNATVTAPPSATNFLDEQLKQDQPGAYGANRIEQQFLNFQDLLRGPQF